MRNGYGCKAARWKQEVNRKRDSILDESTTWIVTGAVLNTNIPHEASFLPVNSSTSRSKATRIQQLALGSQCVTSKMERRKDGRFKRFNIRLVRKNIIWVEPLFLNHHGCVANQRRFQRLDVGRHNHQQDRHDRNRPRNCCYSSVSYDSGEYILPLTSCCRLTQRGQRRQSALPQFCPKGHDRTSADTTLGQTRYRRSARGPCQLATRLG